MDSYLGQSSIKAIEVFPPEYTTVWEVDDGYERIIRRVLIKGAFHGFRYPTEEMRLKFKYRYTKESGLQVLIQHRVINGIHDVIYPDEIDIPMGNRSFEGVWVDAMYRPTQISDFLLLEPRRTTHKYIEKMKPNDEMELDGVIHKLILLDKMKCKYECNVACTHQKLYELIILPQI